MQEEQLFGVPVGQLLGASVSWRQDHKGANQTVQLQLHWQNRRPSTITAWPPDDQQIGAYVTRCNDVIINGAWMHKGRLAHAIRKVLDAWVALGAEVSQGGSRLPQPH